MSKTNDKHNAIAEASQTFGLHPIVALMMTVVDFMLFSGTIVTAGTGWVVTVPIAIAFSIPCILLQKYNFEDNWGTAIGKGLLVGILTAIPTPLPSIFSIGGGVLGTKKLLMSRSSE
ncbi:MAG: hypothetical protein HF973_18115 [Chloroflexi bacterium]|nr:hypothetical protein [Chloroflexota bacterium]